MLMLDLFSLINISLIVVLTILILKNRSWKNQHLFILIFTVVVIIFIIIEFFTIAI